MWRGGVFWVMLSVGCALACGGRYERNAPTSDAVGLAGTSVSSNGGESASSSGIDGGRGGVASGSGGVVSSEGGAAAVAGSDGVMQASCANQSIAYADYRSQVMDEFSSFSCKLDSDCRSFYDQSACDPSCVLLISAVDRGIIDRLNTFELFNCSTDCWPSPWVTCPIAAPSHCVAGRCQ